MKDEDNYVVYGVGDDEVTLDLGGCVGILGGLSEEPKKTLYHEMAVGTLNPDLWNRIKHPQCVERVVGELEDGSIVEVGMDRPKGLKSYSVHYKVGPCMENCERIQALEDQYGLTGYGTEGCYNGRVDIFPVECLDDLKFEIK